MAGDPAMALAAAASRAICWSRPFRAPTNIIWSAIPSRAGSRTRRWACCSRAGWSARGMRPLGFVANEYALAVWGLGDRRLQHLKRGDLSLAAAVRRGHAGRRPGSLARRIGADEAHLPQLRDHRRADREAVSRRGEIAPPAHDFHRSRLRRAAQAPGRPLAVARGARRRRDRAARHQAACRYALAHQGPNRP